MRRILTPALALLAILSIAALLPMETRAMQDQDDTTREAAADKGADSSRQIEESAQATRQAEDWRTLAPQGTALVMKMQANTSSSDVARQTESISLTPVYTEDRSSPNWGWSQATPSGGLSAYITNPGAIGHIASGEEYYVFVVPVNPAQRDRLT